MNILLLATALFMAGTANAQEKENEFTVDAQLRLRGEYQNGQGPLRSEGASPDGFISDRARLGLGFKRGGLSLKISGQHVGTWGPRIFGLKF